MGADNWAHCPRCTVRKWAELNKRRIKINSMYGTVPVDEFDAARQALSVIEAEAENARPTFREDYEIYGADTGAVTVSYRGECQVCGLELSLREEHPIPGVDIP